VRLGHALFAADRPERLLARLDCPFLQVEFEWERHGLTSPALVSNALVFFKGEWLLYYGAADRRIALAVYRPPLPEQSTQE